jgi:SAM-dependent methyltransferase
LSEALGSLDPSGIPTYDYMNDRVKNQNNMRLYKDLSWTWPIISPPKDYIEEAQFFTAKINEFKKIETRTLLNLGCGGGHMDWTLKKFFEITSIDISPDMLALAKKLNPEIEYIEGDMRTVRLDKKFDAVVIHDSILYMQNIDELKAAFKTAYEHLKENGLMITYCEEWPEHFVQNNVRSQRNTKDDIDLIFIENYYDPDPDDSTYEGTFIYLIRRDGELEIFHDYHTFGIFPLENWRRVICEVGFALHETKFTHSDFTDNEFYPMFVGIKE